MDNGPSAHLPGGSSQPSMSALPPLAAQVVAHPEQPPSPPPIRVVVEHGSLLGRAGRWLPWALLAASVLVNVSLFGAYHSYVHTAADDLEEKFYSHEVAATDKVAIITLEGVILDGDGFVKRQIERVRDDDDVKAVVLRIDSPGGTISASHYLFHHLKELCKKKRVPLVVSMGSIAASGGYYVAMAVGAQKEIGLNKGEDVLIAEPTTTTGSIGVILPHYNLEGLLRRWDIEDDSVKSHALKDMGSMTRKMTPEERAKFQSYINDSFNRFKEVIRYGRPHFAEHPGKLDALATGEIFTAGQALDHRLVDREGYLDDAIDRAIELANLDPDNVRVVRYNPPLTLMDVLAGEVRASRRGLDAAVLEMTTPRAYYLCSWLPGLTAATAARP